MKENQKLVELIANALLEYETLTKEQIDYLVEHGEMPKEEQEEELNLTELREQAKEKGIKGYNKLSKEELSKELEDKE